jgi:hypothetical protein
VSSDSININMGVYLVDDDGATSESDENNYKHSGTRLTLIRDLQESQLNGSQEQEGDRTINVRGLIEAVIDCSRISRSEETKRWNFWNLLGSQPD